MKRIKIYKIFKNKVPQEYRLEDHKHMWNLVSLDEITIKLDNINIKDKSFYRYEKLSLPRVKVDKLKEDHNISFTIIQQCLILILIQKLYHRMV